GLADGRGLGQELLRPLRAQLLLERVPLVELFEDGVDVEGRVHEYEARDADLAVVGIQEGEVRALERAQAQTEKGDAGGFPVVARLQHGEPRLASRVERRGSGRGR